MRSDSKAVVDALHADIAALIEKHGLTHAKVAHKTNQPGSLVVALIVPATLADPDKWGDEPTLVHQQQRSTHGK